LDGRYLFFNNRNDPRIDTKLYFAERIDDLAFDDRGEMKGVNTRDLEAVPSLDRRGNLYASRHAAIRRPSRPSTVDASSSFACHGDAGAVLVGEVVRYKDTYRLCCIRGPEGVLIGERSLRHER
jgi:hypothetical protein